MSSRAKVTFLIIAALCLIGFIAGRGSHNVAVDFAFRIATLGLFIALACYLWGAKIKTFFKERSAGIANEFSSLEEAKAQAMRSIKEVGERVSSLDKERRDILDSYRAQGEALRKEIISKAERAAAQIVAQAEASAQNERDKAIERLRAEIAEEITAAAEKLLQERLNAAEHEKLISKSLTKVVLN